MRLKPDQLDGALRQRLAPIYLISGDEPLQCQECADAVRAAARAHGYSARSTFFADVGLDWSAVQEALYSPALFGDRSVVDVRLNGAPDKTGAALLKRYAQQTSPDVLLLVSLPRLKSDDQKAAWLQAIEPIGVIVTAWPLEGAALLDWLERRLSKRGLSADRTVLHRLAARLEGNLLAAAQEVEKLYVLYGQHHLSEADIQAAVADHARYDVFALSDAMLAGQAARAVRILQALRAEGEAAPVVLWALTRELRLLLNLQLAGGQLEQAYRQQRVAERRKPLLQRALTRLPLARLHQALRYAAHVDAAIKGMAADDPWESLQQLVVGLAAQPVVPFEMDWTD